VKSLAYHPQGEQRAEDFTFPYESNSFDVILLKSVFTHMRPAEVENYLREVSRLLKEDGRCLATFFLLNEEQRALAVEGRNALEFSFAGTKVWRYVYEHSPESASAYEESYVLSLLERYGLSLEGPVNYGTWTGRKDGLSFQDMLIIKRALLKSMS
jgi:SAM-dependent methyltransferase